MGVDQAILDMISAHLDSYHRDPDAGHDWKHPIDGNIYPTLLLTMVGRSSRKKITRPLIYARNGNDFLIVASLGGAPDHPAWYKNLQADPDCEIQVRHDHYKVKARTASNAEHEALWKIVAGIFPTYNDYQALTNRKIPVVVLEPRS